MRMMVKVELGSFVDFIGSVIVSLVETDLLAMKLKVETKTQPHNAHQLWLRKSVS